MGTAVAVLLRCADLPLEHQLSEEIAALPAEERAALAKETRALQDYIRAAVDRTDYESGLRLLRVVAHYAADVVHHRYGKDVWDHLLVSMVEMESTLDDHAPEKPAA